MIVSRKAAARVAALTLAAALGGCVTVFPKAPPIQLYRFGASPVVRPAVAGGAQVRVLRAPTVFVTAAEGDRLLTSSGHETAYIANARWVSAAAVLFDEAEARVFSDNEPVVLVQRGGMASARMSLRLDVQTFEADYRQGERAAPTVVVEVRAELTRLADHQILAAKTFTVEKLAATNQVGAIVDGYDAATSDVLGQIAAWTAGQGR